MKCTQCGSDNLLNDLRVVDRGEDNSKGDLQIEMELNPQAMLFTKPVSTSLTATMCCLCGNVMFSAPPSFATNLKEILANKEAGKNPTKHPLYQTFLSADSSRKYLEPNDIASKFGAWLHKHKK